MKSGSLRSTCYLSISPFLLEYYHSCLHREASAYFPPPLRLRADLSHQTFRSTLTREGAPGCNHAQSRRISRIGTGSMSTRRPSPCSHSKSQFPVSMSTIHPPPFSHRKASPCFYTKYEWSLSISHIRPSPSSELKSSPFAHTNSEYCASMSTIHSSLSFPPPKAFTFFPYKGQVNVKYN